MRDDPSATSDQDLPPGTHVGEYEVEAVIGRGGFGTVYRAVQPLIGKRVAIKVLARKYSVDPEIVSRFVAEARAVNQIRHRHIIDIFSFGHLADGRHYYVMEHLEGEPLDQYIAKHGAMRLAEALPILRAIGRALDAAHAKGIAHRDLKPENIFIARDADGERYPKLLDFGIAKLMGPDASLAHHTGTGVPLGTPYYMSPEQCRGRDVDHRTDIYSFGVLAYRLLTGTYPFEGEVIEILHQQMHATPPPPSARNAALTPEVDRAVLSMMQKDPVLRPPSVLGAVSTLDGPPPMPARRRWVVPVIGGGVLAAAAVVFVATRDGEPAPPVVSATVVTPLDAAIPADAERTVVTIEVTGVPDGTQVMIAGAVIGVTPTPVQVKRGTAAVTLVFQADGYRPASQQLVPEHDQTIAVKLQKRRRAPNRRDAGVDELADPFKR